MIILVLLWPFIWNCLSAHAGGSVDPTSRAAGFHSVSLGFVMLRADAALRLLVLYSITSWQHDGSLPVTKCLLSSGACSICKTKAGDPLQLGDVNHKEAFLKHNGFSFLSDTKAFFFFLTKPGLFSHPCFQWTPGLVRSTYTLSVSNSSNKIFTDTTRMVKIVNKRTDWFTIFPLELHFWITFLWANRIMCDYFCRSMSKTRRLLRIRVSVYLSHSDYWSQ